MSNRLKLRTQDDREVGRHATWLELFYDLVYVAAVAQLAHMLEATPSGWGLVIGYLLFIPLWWAWVGHTMYADRFDADDWFHRVTTLLQMLGAVGLAIFIPTATGEGANGFAIFYIFIRVMLLVQYMRVRHHIPESSKTIVTLLAMIGIGIAIWMISLKIAAPRKYLFWLLALAAEYAIAIFRRESLVSSSASSHHLPERLGLFMIIVLGESIISLSAALTEVVWSMPTIVAALLAFILIAMIWWFYFDYVEEFIAGELARDESSNYALYLHLHLFLLFGIVTFAAGLKRTLIEDSGLWMVAVGTSLFILALGVIRHRLHEPDRIITLLPAVGYSVYAISIAAIHFEALRALLFITIGFGVFFALESRKDNSRRSAEGEQKEQQRSGP